MTGGRVIAVVHGGVLQALHVHVAGRPFAGKDSTRPHFEDFHIPPSGTSESVHFKACISLFKRPQ